MTASSVRHLFYDTCPLLFGDNFNRVAPVHVVNGFLAAAVGISDKTETIREAVLSDTAGGKALDGAYSFLNRGPWLEDEGGIEEFQRDFRILIDPDRRAWATKGTLFPVHQGLIGYDPSDDGFGVLLWSLTDEHCSPDFWETIRALLNPDTPGDPISVAGSILGDGASVEGDRRPEISDTVWFAGGAGGGKTVGANFVHFLERLLESVRFAREGADRLLALQHLTRALHFLGTLGILYGPLALTSSEEVESADDLSRLVVWAGMAPGPNNHPAVIGSAQSLQVAVQQHRDALAKILADRLEQVQLPSKLPTSQRRRTALKQLIMAGGGGRSDAQQLLDALEERSDIDLSIPDVGDEDWCASIVEVGYSSSFLTRAFRQMAKKVGFAAPSRSGGRVRLVVETPLLATLVAGLTPSEGCDFRSFVDNAREELGLVLGIGSNHRIGEDLPFWEGGGMVHQLLLENEEQMRQRLVRAGLAREYSDGNTVVQYE